MIEVAELIATVGFVAVIYQTVILGPRIRKLEARAKWNSSRCEAYQLILTKMLTELESQDIIDATKLMQRVHADQHEKQRKLAEGN